MNTLKDLESELAIAKKIKLSKKEIRNLERLIEKEKEKSVKKFSVDNSDSANGVFKLFSRRKNN